MYKYASKYIRMKMFVFSSWSEMRVWKWSISIEEMRGKRNDWWKIVIAVFRSISFQYWLLQRIDDRYGNTCKSLKLNRNKQVFFIFIEYMEIPVEKSIFSIVGLLILSANILDWLSSMSGKEVYISLSLSFVICISSYELSVK